MKRYEEINIEIVLLNGEDIITSSPNDGGFNSDGDTNFAW